MQKLTSRILCALLALASAATVSCGGDSGSTDTTTQSGDTTTDEVTTEDPLADNLPERNYNGEDFVIVTETSYVKYAIQDEGLGEVVSDAVYRRNVAVEERFGINLTIVDSDDNTLKTMITNSIQSDDDEYDLICYHVVQAGALAMEGLFNNWYDIDYVDFSRPWWSPSTTNDLSVDGYCPLAIGDFAMSALANTYCVYFNHRIADEYKLGNIYDIVNDGKWTLDKSLELSKNVYLDINKNNEVDEGDQFGYVSTCRSSLNAYLWSFGGKVIEKGEDGLELVYHSERTGDMVTKLCSYFNENTDIGINKPDADYSSLWSVNIFKEGRALFNNGSIAQSLEHYREMKDDFGIIPYPKWDEAQDDYYTMVDGSHDILAVPKTVEDTERVGIITEALCAETYKEVIPAYYEVALKTKYARDDESVMMLDKVVNSRIFDIGYVYDTWNGASFIFQTLVSQNKPIFESYWASNSSAIETHYQEVIDFFANGGAE